MPEIGEMRKGRDINKGCPSGNYIWASCLDCGKTRWVYFIKGQLASKRCIQCATKESEFKLKQSLAHKGKRNPLTPERRDSLKQQWWINGKTITQQGYVLVWVADDDFFASMKQGKSPYVFEHRLIMAKSLGRNLHKWEIVHHKNHIKGDNRIENLQLVSDDRHKQITILEERIKQLESRITQLESRYP